MRRRHAAARILAENGVTVAALATHVGVTRREIVWNLAGRNAVFPEWLVWRIVELVHESRAFGDPKPTGFQVADAVVAAAYEERKRRKENR